MDSSKYRKSQSNTSFFSSRLIIPSIISLDGKSRGGAVVKFCSLETKTKMTKYSLGGGGAFISRNTLQSQWNLEISKKLTYTEHSDGCRLDINMESGVKRETRNKTCVRMQKMCSVHGVHPGPLSYFYNCVK